MTSAHELQQTKYKTKVQPLGPIVSSTSDSPTVSTPIAILGPNMSPNINQNRIRPSTKVSRKHSGRLQSQRLTQGIIQGTNHGTAHHVAPQHYSSLNQGSTKQASMVQQNTPQHDTTTRSSYQHIAQSEETPAEFTTGAGVHQPSTFNSESPNPGAQERVVRI